MEEPQTQFEESSMMTEQEMTNMTEALKNPEFRKLLADYCNEVSDPKNQALYEQELIQYEAERGIDLTFITPEPCFVIKTIADGREKAFINVCRNAKVDRPTSRYACNEEGRRGLHWSIPLTQAPPRKDVDNKKNACTVYDVVFHPDTLHLATRNREFRQLVVSTACDAVESAFRVRLDRTNVKFPKMAFKGIPRPTVVRKTITKSGTLLNRRSDSSSDTGVGRSNSSSSGTEEDSSPPPDAYQFYPKIDMNNLNGDRAPTVIASQPQQAAEFTIPKYKLVHRRGVEMHELTYERDAKLNTTLPKELVVTVDLPLLKTSQPVKLDVRKRELELVCEQPAKYKLLLPLPYAVMEHEGRAQFDSKTRQLVVTLPVNRSETELKLRDLNPLTKQTSDSGVDSPSSHSHSSGEEDEGLEEAHDEKEGDWDCFLDPRTAYSLPAFTTNTLDRTVVFTLNVKNVDPESVRVQVVEEEDEEQGKVRNWIHVKFFSVGAGFVPSHYSVFFKFPKHTAIVDHSAEAWDNNVVLQLELNGAVAREFEYGARKDGLQKGHLKKNFTANVEEKKTDTPNTAKNRKLIEEVVAEKKSQAFGVKVREGEKNNNSGLQEVTIELSKEAQEKNENGDEEEDGEVFEEEDEKVVKDEKKKRESKKEKKRKGRSLSESHCEDLKQKEALKVEEEKRRKQENALEKGKSNPCPLGTSGSQKLQNGAAGRKARSVSESGGDILDPHGNLFHFKSILKRRSLVSVSESCSSADEQPGGSCAVSFDTGVGSFGDIPEEEDSDHQTGSCKKTVTFNEVIKKQLFRADASIVGRKLKNMKKRAKKRAEGGRRFSESENSECEDKALCATTEDDGQEEEEEAGKGEGKGARRDSAVDFSDYGGNNESVSHDDEDEGARGEGASAKKQSKKRKGKGKSETQKKAVDLEFKSGMIFNLEM